MPPKKWKCGIRTDSPRPPVSTLAGSTPRMKHTPLRAGARACAQVVSVCRVDLTREGTNGVSTNWVTAHFMLLDRGTCWANTPVNLMLYSPKSARAHLFPQSVKIYYFCSGPISVEPICPQPKHVELTWRRVVFYAGSTWCMRCMWY